VTYDARVLGRCAQLALLGVSSWLGGCTSPAAPEMAATSDVLVIESGRYAEAFEAAAEAGRRAGMPPVVRDVRLGQIETTADFAASLLEPWADPGANVESTVSFQRRRAVFEFAPLDAPAPEAPAPATPDLLGTGEPPPDLTRHEGPLGLRVRVFLERASAPGLRRSTWSRRLTTRAVIVRGEAERLPAVFWTPIGRDRVCEERLRQEVADVLEPPPPS
jgi:hypothetical protein